MTRIHFSLRGVLLIVAMLTLAFATARWNYDWIELVAFSALLGLQCLGLVGAICRTGANRIFWIGFSVFGYAYSLAAFPAGPADSGLPSRLFVLPQATSPYAPTGPAALSDRLLSLIHVQPAIGEAVMAQWTNGRYYAAMVQDIQGGRILVAWVDGSAPSWVTPGQVSSPGVFGRRAAQSVLAILVALVGGTLSRAVFGDQSRSS